MLRDDIIPFLEELRTRKVTNRAVAARLGVSEEHVSRVLKELGIVKIPGGQERRAAKELAAERYRYRKEVAKTLSPRLAARAARCSVRTIYRWRNK